MLKQLRKKLTLLSAALTGCVVLLCCTASFLFVREQYLREKDAAFRLTAQRIETQWQIDGGLTAPWLEAALAEGDYHAALWENGIPLRYSNTEPETAAALLRETSKSEYVLLPDYRIGDLRFPFSRGERRLCIWVSRSQEAKDLLRIGLLFSVLAVGSLALVAWLSWIVAGRSVKPVQAAMDQQDRFVADASHELRSPLTVLKSSLSQLRGQPELAQQDLPVLEQQVDRMQSLVENLLMLSGSAANRGLMLEPVAPDTLLIEFADSMLPLAKQAKVHLEVELPDEAVPRVHGQEALLRRLLSILTENALRFAPEDSDVTLALRRLPNACEISVSDHGPGIPDDEKEKIFDRFYRGSQSRTDTDHFGLGLSVAAQIAELHHTCIHVGEASGRGARFSFQLPFTI
ncbi:MAG: HAMP domain-containing histidine kinase [Oscillospiraceae bacterium]|nr:HAMP domain-containing histidine kinase [Oscillospiraceae bacterium]